MIELHGFAMSPNTRRARLMLEEVEAPYAFVNVDLMKGEQKSEAYKALNPTARVPALVDGDYRLWESNAIVVYLAEKFPARKLGGDSPVERADVAKWMFMNSAHLSPNVARIFAHTIRLPEDQRIPRLVEEARSEVARSLAALDAQLATAGGDGFILGRFTSADVALAPTLSAAPMLNIDLAQTPNVAAWFGRVAAREAWKKSGA